MPRKKTITPVSHKRQRSTTDAAINSTPGSRTSKRIKDQESIATSSAKTTPTRSKYFDDASSEDADEEKAPPDELSDPGYEDEDASIDEASDHSDDTDDFEDSDEDVKAKGRKGRKPKQAEGGTIISKVVQAGKELWREGVKVGLGPGKQVFIEKPKARGDGGIKYMPGKIHPNTMAFLADLKKNNDREWLRMHDPDYRQSWKDWQAFVEVLTEKISEVDETIPDLPPKDLVFRIYRDVRFSSDPTPYKPHFSAAWSRTGRKGPYAGYYVQIQPGGKSFVGSGLWMPEAQPLALLRRDIDRRPERISKVLTEPTIRKHFFGAIDNQVKKAIKAFASQNTENALKTKPKGYDADHPNIELLRLRNFTIGRKVNDETILDPGVIDRLMELVGAMVPFVTYLNSVVMPDADDASEDAEEANASEDDTDE